MNSPIPVSGIPDTVAADERAHTESRFRYEDIAQDGRVKLIGIAQAYGLVWQELLARNPVGQALPRAGILAILTRILIEGDEGSVGIGRPINVETAYQLAHGVDDKGNVNRLYLRTWVDMTGPLSRTHGPAPEGAGRIISVGRASFENVFTRPFAPPQERKVLRFDLPGLPTVPSIRHDAPPPDNLLALPESAVPLDEKLAADECAMVFGLSHTDSNQHVNSMVYPHLFEEAALRRLDRLGFGTSLLARRVEIAYRKPSFAGERVRIVLRAWRKGEQLGAVGGFVCEADGEGAKPRCYLRISF